MKLVLLPSKIPHCYTHNEDFNNCLAELVSQVYNGKQPVFFRQNDGKILALITGKTCQWKMPLVIVDEDDDGDEVQVIAITAFVYKGGINGILHNKKYACTLDDDVEISHIII